jgi:tetratricopeptide (TPR) repeat protein
MTSRFLSGVVTHVGPRDTLASVGTSADAAGKSARATPSGEKCGLALRAAAFALWVSLTAFPVQAAVEDSPEAALNRLYNYDFTGAHRVLDAWDAKHPDSSLGHALQAATFMFTEFARLQILEGEFFTDDKKIVEKKGLKTDPVVRGQFYGELDIARKLAEKRLAVDPKDQDALFVMTVSEGLFADFDALIEKHPLASLGYAKDAQTYAVRLLAINPSFGDAYLTTGYSEYLLGSLPFFVRWFTKFDDTEGNKVTAIQKLQRAAETGRYLGPYAKIMLAIIYVREDRLADSEALLRGLATAYPENPMFKKELEKLSQYTQKKKKR